MECFFFSFGCVGVISCSSGDAILLVLSTESESWIVLPWHVAVAEFLLFAATIKFEDDDVDDEVFVNFESRFNTKWSSEIITDAASTCDDSLYLSVEIIELVLSVTEEQDCLVYK